MSQKPNDSSPGQFSSFAKEINQLKNKVDRMFQKLEFLQEFRYMPQS